MGIEIRRLIEKYRGDFFRGRLKKPRKCELCKGDGCLVWHSSYWREVITLFGAEEIPVKRVRCKECGGTFVVLPVFILKHRRYGADVILLVLEEKKRKTYEKVVSDLIEKYSLALDVLTIWLWKKKVSKAVLNKLKKL